MKKLLTGFLIFDQFQVTKATFNTVGYVDTCRDDLPVMDCIDMIAQEACSGKFSEFEKRIIPRSGKKICIRVKSVSGKKSV